jgi:methyl-accepting chemotaxis protein
MSIDTVKSRVNSIKNDLEELSTINELYEAEQKLKEIGEKIRKANSEIEDINSDESSYKKPLLNTLKSYEKDLRIYEGKYQNQVQYWEKKRRQEDLVRGNLTGADAMKAQREMGLDNIKEVDNQGLMINSIGENIKGANANLTNINNELQNQGEQMNRIQDHTNEIDSQVKQTGKIMTKMEGRAKCIQILAFLAVILVGLADVGLAIAYIIKIIPKGK